MDFATIDARLLSHPGATKALHEKWGWMVYWVGGKQFACEFTAGTEAKPLYANRHLLSLRCSPERNIELRAEFPDAILPAYYSDGRTWISIDLDAVQTLNGFLRTQIGRYMRIEQLIGSNTIQDRFGFLVGVGSNFIILQEITTGNIMVLDIFSVRLAYVYYSQPVLPNF